MSRTTADRIPEQKLREVESAPRPTLEDMDAFAMTVANGSFVRVSPWFSIGGARELARYRQCKHALVVESGTGRALGLIERNTLMTAPATDIVTRWVEKTSLRVAPSTQWQEALKLMRSAHSNWLVVGTENNVIGIVTRAELEELEEQASHEC